MQIQSDGKMFFAILTFPWASCSLNRVLLPGRTAPRSQLEFLRLLLTNLDFASFCNCGITKTFVNSSAIFSDYQQPILQCDKTWC